MSRTQVQFSIQQLEAHGHLTVKIGPARRKGNIHLIYEPKFAPSRAEVASGRGQGGPDVKAGVAPTSRPEPLIEPLTEPLIPISSISGATGVAPSIDESKKGNPTNVIRLNGSVSNRASARCYSEEDFEWVNSLILDEGKPLTIQAIVAMARQPGCYEYLIDGRQIGAMCRDGYLIRHGHLIFPKSWDAEPEQVPQ